MGAGAEEKGVGVLLSGLVDLNVFRPAHARPHNRQTKIDTSRPWEVALFGLCASQNAWFKDAVLGPTGLDSLVKDLDRMLAPSIPVLDVNWEDVALTLRALAFLSEHEWVARAVEDTIVRSLLGVFRCVSRRVLGVVAARLI